MMTMRRLQTDAFVTTRLIPARSKRSRHLMDAKFAGTYAIACLGL